ncbi:uracil-xanthine permease family protein [Streptomyces sp. NPDC058045]|uniref:uracil-xanthine permease family protein n=1 Tax=Streptomyces sp. NPDC058045 TaxID=3346311 RepID=UPI0036EBFA73
MSVESGPDHARHGDRYDVDRMPPWRTAVPLGVQHVLAMFASNVTIPILLAGAVGAATHTTALLVQAALIVAGLSTLVQTFGIGPVGARLPVVQGTGFAFAAAALPLAQKFGISAVFGGAIAAGVVQFVLGGLLRRLRWLFPPLVTGIVVASVGIALLPTGVTLAAGGNGAKDFGAPVNLLLAGLVLLVTVIVHQYTRGFLSSVAVLCGLVVGYLAAIVLGKVHFSGVGSAAWFALPQPLEFGISFPAAAVVAMSVVAVANSLDTIGCISALTKGGAGRRPTDRELSGGVLADGAGSLIAALFGTVPNTSFSQNAGLIAFTKVMSRHVVSIGGVLLVLLSLLPKTSAAIAAMPPAVLGGAAIVLFTMVAGLGIQMLGEAGLDNRNLLITAVAMGVGLGIHFVPESVDRLPEQVAVLLQTGVVPAALLAVVLNVVLPKSPAES